GPVWARWPVARTARTRPSRSAARSSARTVPRRPAGLTGGGRAPRPAAAGVCSDGDFQPHVLSIPLPVADVPMPDLERMRRADRRALQGVGSGHRRFRMDGKVMSADSHLDLTYLPPDTFTARLPKKWGDEIPHVVEHEGSKQWISGDR